MNDTTRAQGGAICVGAALGALLFILGVLQGSYLALAIPVTILTLFALGLVFWVGWTILTVQVEPEADPPVEPAAPPAANRGSQDGGTAG